MVGHLVFALTFLVLGATGPGDSRACPPPADGPTRWRPAAAPLLSPDPRLHLATARGAGSSTLRLVPEPDWADLFRRTSPMSTPSLWPMRGLVVAGFGRQPGPEGRFNTGLVIAGRCGAPVRAPATGVVIKAGRDATLGHVVVLDHGRGLTTKYGHLRFDLRVKLGARVKRGQTIGFVGLSGRSRAPRLHYEVRVAGVPVHPGRYLPTWSTSR
ncbi:MAG: M23 family metallopeptidase [Proteobacteria bacterium]|nr:M23 family metallopeptidase [Pseudomonadota bacterium]MBU1740530.1 M23 family metallopeptidase [Pseudomonadota bacterium]